MNINFDFDNMFNNIEEIQPTPKGFGPDPRFWKLSRNDDDIGLARIRLLPGKVTKDGKEVLVPYVRIYKYNINLRKLESRPDKQRPGKYIFFTEAESKLNDEIIESLKKKTIYLKIVGSFNKI